MNTWILLLLLLSGSNGCGGRDVSCRDEKDNGRGRECGGGSGRDRDRDRDREHDCGCDRDRERDCDGNDSRFEPRFDARPFGGGETCGCEEKND